MIYSPAQFASLSQPYLADPYLFGPTKHAPQVGDLFGKSFTKPLTGEAPDSPFKAALKKMLRYTIQPALLAGEGVKAVSESSAKAIESANEKIKATGTSINRGLVIGAALLLFVGGLYVLNMVKNVTSPR